MVAELEEAKQVDCAPMKAFAVFFSLSFWMCPIGSLLLLTLGLFSQVCTHVQPIQALIRLQSLRMYQCTLSFVSSKPKVVIQDGQDHHHFIPPLEMERTADERKTVVSCVVIPFIHVAKCDDVMRTFFICRSLLTVSNSNVSLRVVREQTII